MSINTQEIKDFSINEEEVPLLSKPGSREYRKKRLRKCWECFLPCSIICVVLAISLLFTLIVAYVVTCSKFFGKGNGLKIYLTLGFHVNFYHSYRVDVPTEEGFGQDIRIIKKLLDDLDSVPKARATWDFDHIWSLCEYLPKFANHSILERIRQRVQTGKDEVIFMSYNNGLSSVHTEEEFRMHIQRAERYDNCGLYDLFSKVSLIVRPQEMMTTPGNFDKYREYANISAISLYYSSIPFDSFNFQWSPPLSDEHSKNPVVLNNGVDDPFVVIPTYNIGDIIFNGAVDIWLRELRRKQLLGEIKRDLLLFINFDADDNYWYGGNLPKGLDWFPNSGGLHQILHSVNDLPFVEYTSLDSYLSTKSPPLNDLPVLNFTHDTADGSFNGYSSWAEKSVTTEVFSKVQRNRRVQEAFQDFFNIPEKETEKMVESRMKLLSTTNFGLSSPVLARQREDVVAGYLGDMQMVEDEIFQSEVVPKIEPLRAEQFWIGFNSTREAHFGKLQFDAVDYEDHLSVLTHDFFLVADQNNNNNEQIFLESIWLDGGAGSYYVLQYHLSRKMEAGKYGITWKKKQASVALELLGSEEVLAADKTIVLENKRVKMTFEQIGPGVIYAAIDGHVVVDQMQVRMKFAGVDVIGRIESMKKATISERVTTVSISGSITLPSTVVRPLDVLSEGTFESVYSLIGDEPYVVIKHDVSFPETRRKEYFHEESPLLARLIDSKWSEVCPLEISPSFHATKSNPFVVVKQNFMKRISNYSVDYFKLGDKNLNLASVNNHVTDSFAGLFSPRSNEGLFLAYDQETASNFAFLPMKMSFKSGNLYMKMNPFGTYYGKQYFQRSDGIAFDVSLKTGDQYKSVAPSFNGKSVKFQVLLGRIENNQMDEIQLLNTIEGFSSPPVVFLLTNKTNSTSERTSTSSPATIQIQNSLPFNYETNRSLPDGFVASFIALDNVIYFAWEKNHYGQETFIMCRNEKEGSEKRISFEHSRTERQFSVNVTMTFSYSEFFRTNQKYSCKLCLIVQEHDVCSNENEFEMTKKEKKLEARKTLSGWDIFKLMMYVIGKWFGSIQCKICFTS